MRATETREPIVLEGRRPARGISAGTALLAMLPVALLAAMVYFFTTFGAGLVGTSAIPADALGKIDVERMSFRPGGIELQVVNSGPAELTISQVTVNDALWAFSAEPGPTIGRLGRATVRVPYPWIEGAPHAVKLITSNGLAFTRDVPVAATAPEPSPSAFLLFALLGVYVGVVPVFLGLLWFPMMRRLGRGAMDFFLALTAGLLIFLGLDAVVEAIELAARVPAPFRSFSLVAMGILGAFGVLVVVSGKTVGAASGKTEAERRLALAYLIALGVGLHNLGEGLAIGAAYALGKLALGAFLVIGFTVHNTTEGFGIVAPVARYGAAIKHLVAVGLIAGLPTILGTWLGGFIYSDLWAAIFLSVGAGAIFQVVYEIARAPGREGPGWLLSPAGFAGLMLGLLVMYGTGLLVAA